MVKRFMVLLAAVAALVGSVTVAPATAAPQSASSVLSVDTAFIPAVSDGTYSHTFYSCTVDGRRARMKIGYTIGSWGWFHLDSVRYETDWNDHPAFQANAVRLDIQIYGGSALTEISPAWGGSSTTLDDMPSDYWRVYAGGESTFIGAGTDMRGRFYGVGAGSAEGRCDDYSTYGA